ncbi:Cobyrinate a,c-diamide synthase [Desulfovibrionales bacterium]
MNVPYSAAQPLPLPAPANTLPRLVIVGLSGGVGKTIVSLGLVGAFRRLGLAVQPFKKGPDYIDAAWLGLAAGVTSMNLDPFLMPPNFLAPLLADRMANTVPADTAQLVLIEGNRGLFDGKDLTGSCSSAEVARLLNAPVLLVVDATKMTRTVAAIVQGCRYFEPNLRLAGVVLNRTAGKRHQALLAECLSAYTDVPVLGMLPKLTPNPIPERHMGLISIREQSSANIVATLDRLADIATAHLDLSGIWQAAAAAGPLPPIIEGLRLWPDPVIEILDAKVSRPRIGCVRDAALWFYYEENLEALRRAGAELVDVSLLTSTAWPALDGLYLGGGFPEIHVETLANNTFIRRHLASLAAAGLPIYAECGGFMVLAETIVAGERRYPMAGVFPVATELCSRPQGLGYVKARVVADIPFFPTGMQLCGHEFHYSRCLTSNTAGLTFSLTLNRGTGMLGQRDGLIHRNTFAAYTHLHALGVPEWAPRFVAAALAWHRSSKFST